MPDMPKMQIEYWSIDRLIPYARNPRKNDDAVPKMAGLIKEFGFKVPVVIRSTGEVIDGHLRLKAAQRLGLTEVPVVLADEWTPAQVKAFRLAVNRSAEWADWDEELLKLELEELKLEDYDLELIGFDDVLLDADGTEGLTDPDDVPEVQDNPVTRPGDTWLLGKHRLMCGDSTSLDDMQKLTQGELVDMWLTDPPYNVAYEGGTGLTIKNDNQSDSDFRQFLRDAYSAADSVMKPGAVFYIWHADSEGYNFRGAAKDIGWKVRQCLIWVKNSLVLGRQDYQWRHEPCQPAGTMVRTPNGDVPIEELKDGDHVVSFDTYSGSLKGLRDGLVVKTASRHYAGNLYSVSVAGRTTRATDNHQFSIRINPKTKEKFCVYLMRRDEWWRVGVASTYMSRGFGARQRFHQEKAEELWILKTFENSSDAQMFEQFVAINFGIPYTCWEAECRSARSKYNWRTKKQVVDFYNQLDLDALAEKANHLLEAYGRSRKYPLFVKGEPTRMSRRITAKVAACNLIPGLMQIPIPFDGYRGDETFAWADIEAVSYNFFDGKVYSLSVDKFEHYISDGIITHNCLYGFKEGASHLWASDRKQTTVLEFDRPTRSAEHPTMKPVALFEYEMLNNTRGGDLVLDSFGGSGTTMIVAEKNGRRSCLMELDPKYCDVIVRRWQEFTGREATLERDGRAFSEVESETKG